MFPAFSRRRGRRLPQHGSRGAVNRMTAVRPGYPGRMNENPSGATVTLYEDGPLLLRGDVEIRSQDGVVIDPGRSTVALCRCGLSAVKPFCDGTHKVRGFRAAGGDQR